MKTTKKIKIKTICNSVQLTHKNTNNNKRGKPRKIHTKIKIYSTIRKINPLQGPGKGEEGKSLAEIANSHLGHGLAVAS